MAIKSIIIVLIIVIHENLSFQAHPRTHSGDSRYTLVYPADRPTWDTVACKGITVSLRLWWHNNGPRQTGPQPAFCH